MFSDETLIEDELGPKWNKILYASFLYVMFKSKVQKYQLTGEDIAKGEKLLNENEQWLQSGGAEV